MRALAGDGPDDEGIVRAMLDAIADAMPRAAPTPAARRRTPPSTGSFHERLARRLEPRPDAGDLPQLVRISLRVEADEEELVAGRGAARAPGPRRAGPAAPLRRGGALDRVRARREPRVRRPGAHPRGDRAARRGRGVAGARPAGRAAGARPDHPRHRRAGEPAVRRRRGAGRLRGGRPLAAQPGPGPHGDRGPRAGVGRARGQRAADRAVRCRPDVQLPVAGGAARRGADRGGDGPARRGRPRRSSGCAATGR